MRSTVGLLFLLLPSLLIAQEAPQQGEIETSMSGTPVAVATPMTAGQKIRRRELRFIQPVALLGSAVSAGWDQMGDVPHQWGQGAEGFAIRFASAEGNTLAFNTVALGFDLSMHTDPRFRRMEEGSVKARIWNAVSQSFLAYKDSGGRTLNVAELAGNYGAGFITNTWEPAGHNGVGDALVRGTTGLAFHTLKNVGREFLPDLVRRFRH